MMTTKFDVRAMVEDKLFNSALASTKISISNLEKIKSSANLFVWQNILMELGGAFALSGDQRILDHGKALVLYLSRSGWLRQAFTEEIHWAFVLNGIAVFLEHTRNQFSVEELREIDNLIGKIGAMLYEDSLNKEWGKNVRKRNAWNHTAIAYSAIGTAGLLFPKHPEAEKWREVGIERINLFFRDGITNAGMTWEGLAYCGFVFRNVSIMMWLARERNIWDYSSDHDNPYKGKLCRIPEWYEADLFPAGSLLQNWNDSYPDPRPALRGFLMAFRDLNPARTAAVWNRLVGPNGDGLYGHDARFLWSSLYESALFFPDLSSAMNVSPIRMFRCDEVGYFVDTVGEDPKTSKFSFNSGKFIGAIHDQGDNNSFTLFLDGMPVVIDSGAANSPEEGSTSSTFGHNGIVIDGKGQAPCGQGHGCSGQITDIQIHPNYTYVSGDASTAYNLHNYNSLTRANRQCFFVKYDPCYIVVFDDFKKDCEMHKFSLLIQTPTLQDTTIDLSQGLVKGRIKFADRDTILVIRVLHPSIDAINYEMVEVVGQEPFKQHMRWLFTRSEHEAAFITVIYIEKGPGIADQSVSMSRLKHNISISEKQVDLVLRWSDQEKADKFCFTRQVKPGSSSPGAKMIRRLIHSFFPQQIKPENSSPISLYRSKECLMNENSDDNIVPSIKPSTAVATEQSAAVTAELQNPIAWSRAAEHAVAAVKLAGFAKAMAATDYPVPPNRGVVMAHNLYREIGLEFFQYFLKWGDLLPTDEVLDIGCGGGRMAVPLGYYLLSNAHYVGFDVHEPSIQWCRENLGNRWSNFSFDYFNISNSRYNTRGVSAAESFIFPYSDESFSFLIATSVFTHLMRSEVAHYLQQAARVMCKNSRFFCTAYLLTPESEASMKVSRHAVKFKHEFHESLIQDTNNPMAAVAQWESLFRRDVTDAGLIIDRVAYGWWSGLPTGNSKQDIIILRKP